MKHHLRLFAGACVLLLTPMAANATPFTFTFDMPAFTLGDLASTVSVLEVTVDNGGTTILDQSYLNTQVTDVSTDLTGAFTSIIYGGVANVITTDALGIATLGFPAGSDAYVLADNPTSGDFIQLYGNHYQYYVLQGSTNKYGTTTGTSNFPILSRAALVPEPGTLALLAAG